MGRGGGRPLQAVPCWRVAWAGLPGAVEEVAVGRPEHAALLRAVGAGPSPRRFAHFLAAGPGGGRGGAAAAPRVGCLRELESLRELPGGQVLARSVGLCRVRRGATRRGAAGFEVADCEVLFEGAEGAGAGAGAEEALHWAEWEAWPGAPAFTVAATQQVVLGVPGPTAPLPPPLPPPPAASGGLDSVLRAEASVWRRYRAVRRVALGDSPAAEALPEPLASLAPPGAAEPRDRGRRGGLPPFRRALKLSYALSAFLPEFSPEAGRQALLEASSVEARLGLLEAALARHEEALLLSPEMPPWNSSSRVALPMRAEGASLAQDG